MILRYALAASLLAVAAVSPSSAADVPVKLTYNVTPHPSWAPGQRVVLFVDARRSAELGKEDIFFAQRFPGVYPRGAGQTFEITLPKVKPNETIIVQGYMCSEGTSDCYPSDKDNPPSCGARVPIVPPGSAGCNPTFTWTGGHLGGGVICQASCL
jgi:hypothetical protein